MSPSHAYSDFHSALPLPEPGRHSGRTSSTARTRAPSQRGDLGGGVGRAVVDHDDLVDERDVLDEVAPDRGHDLADGGLLVAGREAHRDRRCRPSAFARDEVRSRSHAGTVERHGGQGTRARRRNRAERR